MHGFYAVLALFLLGAGCLSPANAEKGFLPNVSSRLLGVVRHLQAERAQGIAPPRRSETLMGYRVDEVGRLEVMIRTTDLTPDVLRELEGRGSAIEIYDPVQRLVQAWVPLDRIGELAALSFVKFLDLPDYGVTNRP